MHEFLRDLQPSSRKGQTPKHDVIADSRSAEQPGWTNIFVYICLYDLYVFPLPSYILKFGPTNKQTKQKHKPAKQIKQRLTDRYANPCCWLCQDWRPLVHSERVPVGGEVAD